MISSSSEISKTKTWMYFKNLEQKGNSSPYVLISRERMSGITRSWSCGQWQQWTDGGCNSDSCGGRSPYSVSCKYKSTWCRENNCSKRRSNGTNSGQQSRVYGVNRGASNKASLPTRTPGHAKMVFKLLIVKVQQNNCPEYFPAHSPLPPCGLFTLLQDTNSKFCSILTTVGSSGSECTSSLLVCLLLSTLLLILRLSLNTCGTDINTTQSSVQRSTSPPPNHTEYFQHVWAHLTRTISCCVLPVCVNK